jgi:hypothetical protein
VKFHPTADMLNRRGFLAGLLATPALVRAGSLDYVPRAWSEFGWQRWQPQGTSLILTIGRGHWKPTSGGIWEPILASTF